jgi:hypothetical protein
MPVEGPLPLGSTDPARASRRPPPAAQGGAEVRADFARGGIPLKADLFDGLY